MLGPAPDGRHERLIELNVEEVVTPTRVTVGPGAQWLRLTAEQGHDAQQRAAGGQRDQNLPRTPRHAQTVASAPATTVPPTGPSGQRPGIVATSQRLSPS